MTQRKIGPYLEQQILSATPLQLIALSYQTAIQATRDARSFLARKKIMERARAISLAHGVLAELYRALDFKAGNGEISRELGRLYDYMMRRLLAANAQAANAQAADETLAEVLNLLTGLAAAWEALAVTAPHPNPNRARPFNPEPPSNPINDMMSDLLCEAPPSRYSLTC